MFLNTTKVTINKDNIELKIGDDTVVYETDVNSFEENAGMVVRNIIFPVNGIYIYLKDISTTFNCGNVIDTLNLLIQKEYENKLIVIDFDEIEEVTNSFFKSYTKFLLGSTNKIITINMNTALTNAFSNYIHLYIKKEEE